MMIIIVVNLLVFVFYLLFSIIIGEGREASASASASAEGRSLVRSGIWDMGYDTWDMHVGILLGIIRLVISSRLSSKIQNTEYRIQNLNITSQPLINVADLIT